MNSVIFICTGNQYRSPVAAEAFRRRLAQDGRSADWTVASAGTWTTPGVRVPRRAVEVAQSFGLDISRHVTRLLDKTLLEEFNLILVMTEGHWESICTEFPSVRSRVHLLSKITHEVAFDIPDPAMAMHEVKEILMDLIETVDLGYEKICRIAEASPGGG
jgi:protein-tyrosine phosphatase